MSQTLTIIHIYTQKLTATDMLLQILMRSFENESRRPSYTNFAVCP